MYKQISFEKDGILINHSSFIYDLIGYYIKQSKLRTWNDFLWNKCNENLWFYRTQIWHIFVEINMTKEHSNESICMQYCLIDNIIDAFRVRHLRLVLIPMGTNYASILVFLFLFSFENSADQKIISKKLDYLISHTHNFHK